MRSLVFLAFCFLVGASAVGSVVGYTVAAVTLLFCAWAGAVLSVGRAPGDIEVGTDGISTSRWRLAWGGIASVSVERLRFSGETLVVDPVRSSDLVELRRSRVLGLDDRLGGAAQLRIPQRTIELPLADVVSAMEEQAGRTFTGSARAPSTGE